MSGARAMICSSSARMRCLASDCAASSGKMSSPPAIRTSSATQRMPLMRGSSHSSKYTFGRRGRVSACAATASMPACSLSA